MTEKNQYITIYRQEAEELLTEIENTVLDLEENPDDQEAINRLFRAVHTIKGSGSMFGFDEIAEFTHHVENTLDKVRDSDLSISKELIDLILASRDYIDTLLEAMDKGKPGDTAAGASIIDALNRLERNMTEDIEPDDAESPSLDDGLEKTIRIRFIPRINEYYFEMDPENIFSELEKMGDITLNAQIKDIPPLELLDPVTCYIFWDILLTTQKSMNAVRDVFIFVEDQAKITFEIIEKEEFTEEEVENKKLGEILVERDDISPDDLNRVLDTQPKLGQLLIKENVVDSGIIKSALAEQDHVNKIKTKREKDITVKSIRVPAERLDSLVDLVGELVTAQARLTQSSDTINDPDLVSVSEEIERLVARLRDNTMSVRMVQIGITFSNFKRLVRDLSGNLGKKINLITDGGETELDKTVVERLTDPLIHIIRNCIDHGIELPEERKAAAKPREGKIHLSAEHSGAYVLIKISDDGKGINPEIIKSKAIEKGLITADTQMTDENIRQLIFSPGFSTAEEVTDVSGRGVGMDVVKRNIEDLRGDIVVESESGKGTTITLKLPLTLAIIDGLMVVIDENYFILPLSSVEECAELNKEECEQVRGRQILTLRGRTVPYIRIRDQFNMKSANGASEHIVITEINGKPIGFVVDQVIGGHQTVIKPLGPIMKQAKEVSGATILGDGTVALILDTYKLMQSHSVH